MAESATRLPEEDRPVTRPDLRSQEGISSNNTGSRSGGATSGTGSRSGGASGGTNSSGGGASSSTGGGFTNSRSLKGAEESPGKLGAGYTPGNTSSTSKLPSLYVLKRKRAVFGAVGTSTIIGVVAFSIFSISSGPLEFVHIAQLLEKFHFSAQQDGEDSRLTKIVQYLHDPSKPQNTRLGVIGNKIADKLETKINDATGLHSEYDSTTGTFIGYTADPEHQNFKGMTTDEIKASLASTYGLDANSMKTVTFNGKETVQFNPSSGKRTSIIRFLNQTKFSRTLLGKAGYSKLSARVGTRVLTRRAGWTFHPIKEIDAKILAAATKAGKSAVDKLKQAAQDKFFSDVEGTIDVPGGSAEPQQQTDSSGKPLPPDAQSTANADGVNGVQATAQSENPTDPASVDKATASLQTKVAGGGAALIGVVCVMHSIDKNISTERQAKVILPMMRFAGEFVNLGSQVQSGKDINATQLSFYKDYLDGKDANGNTTSTWNQARSIQAELGQPQTGPDIPKAGQVFNNDVPFSAIEGPVTDTACSILGSTFGQIFSIVTGPISYIVSGAILKDAVSTLSGWLSGAPTNIKTGAGAADGNYMNYGARASANDQYASAGGVQMGSGDEATLKNTTAVLDNSEFQSKSLAYRIFNPDDSQTLAAKVIDNYGSGGVTEDFASVIRNFGSIFSSVFNNLASVFSGITNAAPQPYDYHGLKKVGFTAAELTDPLYDNPFQNSCDVTGGCTNPDGTPIPPTTSQSILGDPSNPNQDYINRAMACFGDTISYDGTIWNIDYGSAPVDVNSDSYTNSNCNDSSVNWMRLRFWILDTQTIEGYDCGTSISSTSDQSCSDVGFPSSSSSSTTSQPTTTSTVNGLVDPLSKVSGLTASRVDQGVDYSGSGPILAIGDGTILSTTNTGWPGGTFIVIKLDAFPDKYVYVAENCQNIKVTAGQHVKAGDELCTLQNAYPNLEIGWADGSKIGNAMAHDVWSGNDSTSNYTAFGQNFSQLLQKLNAPLGTIQPGATELGTLPPGWPSW